MDTLVNVVIVLAMIAITAFVIHLLNTRHRHQHLRPAHYDHGLAGFEDRTATAPTGGRRSERGTEPLTDRRDVDGHREQEGPGSG
ncbi:hypothetical protein [Streptomyces sp. NPDC014734]|uniref:hypothetical protein n=1 Tax=Streptomyces sp. NPDC014734 TaxID=3364886 RepID=UPI0036FF529E